tara:strand:- start:1228 stop:1512 length:285 start_codon:yes stop_codon:yes gene_type:complete
MTTLAAWCNERMTGAFVKWIEHAPEAVAELVEGVILKVLTAFTGWDWVGDAVVSGANAWIASQQPERVELLVESGIEGWVASVEAAALLADTQP